MKFGFSMSKRIGTPAVPAAAPSPGAERLILLTSWVDTNPAEVDSNRKLTPLPVTMVASPPPPWTLLPVQAEPLPDVPAVKGLFPWPIQMPEARLGQVPPQRSKSAAVSRPGLSRLGG